MRRLLFLLLLLGLLVTPAAAQNCTLQLVNGVLTCVSAQTGTANALDTALPSAHGGLDVFTLSLNNTNIGLALYPRTATLPLNPSGNIPFALTVLGDTFLGDVYCLADDVRNATVAPNSFGCVIGRRVGIPVGPILIMSGQSMIPSTSHAGPMFSMWPDESNADGSGNRGYMDIWAWGVNDSGFSNTLNFGNRDPGNTPHRRFRILNDGKINLPDLTGSGVERLCIDAAGSLQRGGC